MTTGTGASGPRRRISPGLPGAPPEVDVLVAGLGATGAGAALDAVTRGLSVLAVDAHDLAFGTSRWSSKLVHGGLRYLAGGHVAIAHESAVERGVLMDHTAPHLTRAMPIVVPLTSALGRLPAAATSAALLAGDVLRRSARTRTATLPRPRRLSATELRALAPPLRPDALRGGLLSWDGQLEDDARLVVTLARTAAEQGAAVHTRVRVLDASGVPGRIDATVRDELTGETGTIRARALLNATGVWAGGLASGVRLRPSRGTHLVLRGDALPGLRVGAFVAVPGERNRFVLVLPQPDGLVYVGLTDEPVTGPVPDVPTPTEAEIGFLLEVISTAFSRPPRREDVVGAFAGLRPLLDGPTPDGRVRTTDLSRRHAVTTGPPGVVTVVGGKLTTYRRMAEDAVDAAVAHAGLDARRCVTRRLPLSGAAPRPALAALPLPRRLVRRYGADAALVLATAREVSGLGEEELLAPLAPTVPTTLAELVFGLTHEGATDVGDLLDRRTRIGLVPADRHLALPAAHRALHLVGARGGDVMRPAPAVMRDV